MDYADWEAAVPATMKEDTLWRMRVYRLAAYVADLGWDDITCLTRDRRTAALADQLYRALGSIGANIAEGYSRSSNKDRGRFYEYALGSTRESRHWYYKARHTLPETAIDHRLDLLGQIIRLLLVMIPDQRTQLVKESSGDYLITD